MTNFKITTTINRPVEIVDKVLMNPENFPYWDRYLEKFEAFPAIVSWQTYPAITVGSG